MSEISANVIYDKLFFQIYKLKDKYGINRLRVYYDVITELISAAVKKKQDSGIVTGISLQDKQESNWTDKETLALYHESFGIVPISQFSDLEDPGDRRVPLENFTKDFHELYFLLNQEKGPSPNELVQNKYSLVSLDNKYLLSKQSESSGHDGGNSLAEQQLDSEIKKLREEEAAAKKEGERAVEQKKSSKKLEELKKNIEAFKEKKNKIERLVEVKFKNALKFSGSGSRNIIDDFKPLFKKEIFANFSDYVESNILIKNDQSGESGKSDQSGESNESDKSSKRSELAEYIESKEKNDILKNIYDKIPDPIANADSITSLLGSNEADYPENNGDFINFYVHGEKHLNVLKKEEEQLEEEQLTSRSKNKQKDIKEKIDKLEDQKKNVSKSKDIKGFKVQKTKAGDKHHKKLSLYKFSVIDYLKSQMMSGFDKLGNSNL